MKKITLLISTIMLLAFTWQSTAQTVAYQTFMATGNDSDPTVLSIAPEDITAVPDDAVISALSLENFVVHYNSETGTTTYCGNWYDFNVDVDAANVVLNGCDTEINGTDVFGFTSIDISSNDLDAYSDTIYVFVDLAITFVPTAEPSCSALITPMDGAAFAGTSGDLAWSVATGGVDGYYLTVGTTSGGGEVFATADVGNVNTYNVGALAEGTMYYVTVTPYNVIGSAVDCTEASFTTFSPPTNDLCADAIELTVGGAIDENNVQTHNLGATDSGETAPGCGSYNGGDVWFTAVVPVTGTIVFETIRDASSTMSDTGLAIYSGDCGALTLVECDDDDSEDGAFSMVALTGQTPGDVLYFRAWEYGNNLFDTFSVVAYDPTAVDNQEFCADGQDQDEFQLIFNAADITVNEGTAIYAVVLDNFVSHYSTPDGTTTWCPDWYNFTLNVDGVDVVTGCASDINGYNLTGFTTASVTIHDMDAYDDHVYICGDLVVYHEAVTCPMPVDLTATDITIDSATLGWTAGGDEVMWNLEYGEAGFALGSGTNVPDLDVNSYGLTALMAGTGYEFYVQSGCDSSWAGPFAFFTEVEVGCGAFNVSNDFENGNGCISTSTFHVANDLLVTGGETLDLYKVVANFITDGVIASADIVYYDDNAGVPNNILGSETVVPTSQDVIGDAFGFDVKRAVFDVTPFSFDALVDDTTYWVELYVTLESGTAIYWEITSASIIGNPTANLNTAMDPPAWAPNGDGADGVYEFYATCHGVGVADAVIDGFRMYPNPVENTLNINANNRIDAISIFNLLGQEVLTSTPSATQVQIDMSELQTGAYIVKVNAGDQVGSYNLIKQ